MVEVQNVVITGANRGIGLEFCRQLVALNKPPKNVFASCRDPEKAEALQWLKTSTTATNIHIIKIDVDSDDDILAASKEVAQVVGDDGLSLLINNAGVMGITAFPGTPSKVYMEHFRTNTVAPIMLSEAFLPLLILASDKKSGSLSCNRAAIINITGFIGHFCNVDYSIGRDIEAYRMSKVALNMANAIMARNLKESGILVSAIHPGWVQTDMGGDGADLKVTESVSSVLKTMGKLSEIQHGKVVDFSGNILDW